MLYYLFGLLYLLALLALLLYCVTVQDAALTCGAVQGWCRTQSTYTTSGPGRSANTQSFLVLLINPPSEITMFSFLSDIVQGRGRRREGGRAGEREGWM